MKKTLLIFSIVASLFFAQTVFAQNPNQQPCLSECIIQFDTTVAVQTSGAILVQEKIIYDYAGASKHGFFRTIPYGKTNAQGKKFVMEISDISIIDESGRSYQFSQSDKNQAFLLQVGDANTFVSGIKTYIISYMVKGAITYFSDHDEIFWNMTGNEWPVPIQQATAKIMLPNGVVTMGQPICYTGGYGSTEKACEFTTDGSTTTVSATRSLASNEGMSVAVSFPINMVARLEPTADTSFWNTMLGSIVIVILMIIGFLWYFVLPLWLPIKWMLYGRDPSSITRPVSAWFDPPKTKKNRLLTPAETGTLIDESADLRDITGMIVHLAQRGYLKIIEKAKDDFSFLKTKEFTSDETLQSFERTFLQKVFGSKQEIRLKDNDLSSAVATTSNQLYESLVQDGFFAENPQKIRTLYYVLAGVGLFSINILLALSAFIFGRIMPKKTQFGVEQLNVAKSLKNFLKSQERQLEFQAKNQLTFEKLLPYAIVFGVEKIWADRFKDISLQQPEWYQGYETNSHFTTTVFAHSLASSMSSFRSAATPTSSSSGFSSGSSSFSGGGGGGGGGGSW